MLELVLREIAEQNKNTYVCVLFDSHRLKYDDIKANYKKAKALLPSKAVDDDEQAIDLKELATMMLLEDFAVKKSSNFMAVYASSDGDRILESQCKICWDSECRNENKCSKIKQGEGMALLPGKLFKKEVKFVNGQANTDLIFALRKRLGTQSEAFDCHSIELPDDLLGWSRTDQNLRPETVKAGGNTVLKLSRCFDQAGLKIRKIVNQLKATWNLEKKNKEEKSVNFIHLNIRFEILKN